MVRMHRVTVDAMSDEWLLHAYRRAAMLAATNVLAQLAPEVINRESMGGTVDKAEACGLLAGGSPTSEEAIEWLTKAREWAAKEKESPARWLLAELDLRPPVFSPAIESSLASDRNCTKSEFKLSVYV